MVVTRLVSLAVLALPLAGCVEFDLFSCGQTSDCVLNGLPGRCEATGYCSFPDPECGSGQRYSEHAPSDLARACVPNGGESEAGTGVGESTDTGGSESTGTSGDLACEDLDGDGAGVGPGCTTTDCDDDNPNAIDTCVYVAPDGDDQAAGTADAPWRTFARAISALGPGDSLIVRDGLYRFDDHGTLVADCMDNAAQGTAQAPIHVRAEHDRAAIIDRDARDYGVAIRSCSHWRARGFTIISGDTPAEEGRWRAGLHIGDAQYVEARQMSVHHANRYYNEHVINVHGSKDILLEDVEAHDFFRAAYSIWYAERVTLRRCYGHSHGAADLPLCPDPPGCADNPAGSAECPRCSSDPERGDATFSSTGSRSITFENCVSEGSDRGYSITGGILDGSRAGDIRLLGSMSIADDRAVVIEDWNPSAEELEDDPTLPSDAAPYDVVLDDFLALRPNSTAIEVQSPAGLVLRNVSVLGGGSHGLWQRINSTEACDGPCSLTVERSLIDGVVQDGIHLEADPAQWSIVENNLFDIGDDLLVYATLSSDPPEDDEGNAQRNRFELPTGVGTMPTECAVYIPTDSPMYDPFGDGRSIGAQITNILEDGLPTDKPLWTADGFACGPEPAMPAPIPGERCADLAGRVQLGEACPPPPPAL